MMARGTKGSKQRPDTLMQGRTSPTRRSLLATHGRTIHLGHSRPMRSKPREYACPQADRRAEVWPSPLSAISDLMHCKKGRQALASDSLLKINLTRQVVAPPNRQPLG